MYGKVDPNNGAVPEVKLLRMKQVDFYKSHCQAAIGMMNPSKVPQASGSFYQNREEITNKRQAKKKRFKDLNGGAVEPKMTYDDIRQFYSMFDKEVNISATP